MADWTPLRDYSRSRAVLIANWKYAQLTPVAAVENSLDRMVRLLTGPLCGWPGDRLQVFANESGPGDLPDRLITAFEDVPDVALFYFAGHGLADKQDHLCLALTETVSAHNRRAATSLPYEAVRSALLDSPATTKIVILDCCYAGLANRPGNTLAALTDDLLDRTGGSGAYTMAASGADRRAWIEADPHVERPQTYFTKYLADVIEEGIVGKPALLSLQLLFRTARDRLAEDHRPVPSERNVDAARDFVFAHNAAPAEFYVDQDAEIRKLRQLVSEHERQLRESEQRRVRERESARALEQQLTTQMHKLAEDLQRLRDQARHAPPPTEVEQQELTDRIEQAQSMLDEAAVVQEETARRAVEPSAASFSAPSSFALETIWRAQNAAVNLALLAAAFAVVNLFGAVTSTNPHRGITQAEMTVVAYIIAAVTVAAFIRVAALRKRHQYEWQSRALAAGSLAAAAVAHAAVTSPLSWILSSVLLLTAFCGAVTESNGIPERRTYVSRLAVSPEGMDIWLHSSMAGHIPWSDTRGIASDQEAVYVYLLREPPPSSRMRALKGSGGKRGYRLFPHGHFGNDASVIEAIEVCRGSLSAAYDPAMLASLQADLASEPRVTRGAAETASPPVQDGKRLQFAKRRTLHQASRRADLTLRLVEIMPALGAACLAALISGALFTAVYFSGILLLVPLRLSAAGITATVVLGAFALVAILVLANESVGGITVVLSEAGRRSGFMTAWRSRPQGSGARQAFLRLSNVRRSHVVIVAVMAASGAVLAALTLKLLHRVRIDARPFFDSMPGRVAQVVVIIAIAVAVAGLAAMLNNVSGHLEVKLSEQRDGGGEAERREYAGRSALLRIEWISAPQVCLHVALSGILAGGIYLSCSFGGLFRALGAWAVRRPAHELDVAWLGAGSSVVVVVVLVAVSNLLLRRGAFRVRLAESD
jgi:hypothetical protein